MAKRTSRKINPKLLTTHDEFQQYVYLLITHWANAETWFFRVLAELMRTDFGRADLIFSSITSTRARIELTRRAALMCLSSEQKFRAFDRMFDDFKKVSKMRNEICHSEYVPDETRTIMASIMTTNFSRQDFDGTNYLHERYIDRNYVNEIKQAYLAASRLCDRLERFVKTLPPYVLEQPRDKPLRLRKRPKTKDDHRPRKKER